jgi:hypothetical protein
VAAGSGAAPAHGGTDGGSPGLGGPSALVHQTRRGKGQNREGTTLNSPRQSVLSGMWRFGLAVMMFPFALSRPVWVLLPSTAWCIPHLGLSYPNHNGTELGQSPTIPTVAIPVATATTL